MLQFTLSPRWITGLLAAAIAFLTIAHTVVHVCWRADRCGALATHGWLFNLGNEMNVPTWFASSQLLLCSALLALIAATQTTERRGSTYQWGALAIIFAYLSLDEATDMHGLWRLLLPADFRIPGTSHPEFAWVIPGLVLVILCAILFRKFVFMLPKATRFLFIVAGAVYVSGVMGFELLGAFLADDTWLNLSYIAVETLEEVGEMVGILIFVYALLSYLRGRTFQVQVGDSRPHDTLAALPTNGASAPVRTNLAVQGRGIAAAGDPDPSLHLG